MSTPSELNLLGYFRQLSWQRLAISFCLSILLVISFLVIFSFTSKDESLKYSLSLDGLEWFPLKATTSIFVHNDEEHLRTNSISMLFLGTIFFYFWKPKKGFIGFLGIGFAGKTLEVLFMEVAGRIQVFVIEESAKCKPSYGGYIGDPPSASGAGASGALIGMSVILIIAVSQELKQQWQQLNYDICILLVVIVLLGVFFILYERIAADFQAFFEPTSNALPDDKCCSWTGEVWKTVTNCLCQLPTHKIPGNPALGHFWGIISGTFVLFIHNWYRLRQRIKGSPNHSIYL